MILYCFSILLALYTSITLHASGFVFSDVYDVHIHTPAIRWMTAAGVTKGYADGSYRPDRKVNRAEVIKMTVLAKGLQQEVENCREVFSNDVHKDDWFAPYVCVAHRHAWIQLSDDNPTVRPSDLMNVGEASAFLARAYALPFEEDVPWYAPSIRALAMQKAIPQDVEAVGQNITRGQIADMLWRLEENPEDVEFVSAEQLLNATCSWQSPLYIQGVDVSEISRGWLMWVNAIRLERGLAPLILNAQLSKTAQEWSDVAKNNGNISHKRANQTSYYDYDRMQQWFADRELIFKNTHRTTFTENIGWGVYTCTSKDCTQDLLTSVRTTFDYFVSEEQKEYRPHWNSMINPYFKIAGIGIAVDASKNTYYITVHYATSITSEPRPICP